MIFFKKFYADGFKSFANKITVKFDEPMTGIVGPNGSGKSNIIDAFKWVLGEQSVKDMRGNDKFDLIFKGSESHPEAKYAEVTLYFNNENNILKIDTNQVTITRKLTRSSGLNEYYINHEHARLKDIQLLFTNIGLAKGSLGIISQGTVNFFTETKPENRRKIFEEAAGISLYTTKKNESLNNLTHVTNTLENIKILENEVNREYTKLAKQVENAQKYSLKFEQLKEIEITILIKDISYYLDIEKQISAKITEYEKNAHNFEPEENELYQHLNYLKQKITETDYNLAEFNEKLLVITGKISKIEKEQLLINSDINNKLNSGNKNEKINAYEKLIQTYNTDILKYKEQLIELKEKIEIFNEIHQSLETSYNSKLKETTTLNDQLTSYRTKANYFIEQLSRKNNSNYAVRAILENKNALRGIYNTVGSYLDFDEKFNTCLAKAFGRSTENIIVDNMENAKEAILFLKRNKVGHATFLPLEEIRNREVRNEHLIILKDLEGFVGVASELINVQPKMRIVINALVGTVIISETIESAIRISKYMYHKYKIISLDGDLILPGGIVSGGFERQRPNFFNLDKDIANLKEKIVDLTNVISNKNIEINRISIEKNETQTKLNQKNITFKVIENNLLNAQENFDKYKMEYEILTDKKLDDNSEIKLSVLDEQLNELNHEKTKIEENITFNKNNKVIYSSDINEKEETLNELRKKHVGSKDEYNTFLLEQSKCENIINNAKNRISENYKMTMDFALSEFSVPLTISDDQARSIIETLRHEIDALGNINLEAIDEFEKIELRRNGIIANREEIEEAILNLNQIINELDKAAKIKFMNVIDKVNAYIPKIFKFLFGGGSCEVFLTDPDDILKSGINILANPPGKKVVNLKLLSGGEKTLVAIAVLFTILKVSNFPIIILDEAEAALDLSNVEKFGQIIKKFSNETQFLIITHRPGTMKQCPSLLGTTMLYPGVTTILPTNLDDAIEAVEQTNEN